MDDAISRRRIGAGELSIQAPVAYLTCNFSAPVPLMVKSPRPVTHDESSPIQNWPLPPHLLTQVEDWVYPGSTAWNGMRWNCPANSWKILLGAWSL